MMSKWYKYNYTATTLLKKVNKPNIFLSCGENTGPWSPAEHVRWCSVLKIYENMPCPASENTTLSNQKYFQTLNHT